LQSHGNPEMCRLAIGRFIGDVLSLMTSRVQNSTPVKFALYSGHDNTISPFLISFKIFDNLHPPVASTVVLELYEEIAKENPQHYVRVVYNNKVLKIPEGRANGLCDFSTFKKLAEELVPKDYEKECSIPYEGHL